MNTKDSSTRYTKHIANFSLGINTTIEQLLNLNYLIISQYSSTTKIISTLINHVMEIVLLSPKKQMVWINTRSIIALMKNLHELRHFTFVNNP